MSQQESWEDILYILAMTVIIDQRVRDPELSEFMVQARGLCEITEDCEARSTNLEDWFKANEPKILEAIRSRGKNTVILRALTKIKDQVMRENVYDAMIAISLSDKEFHKVESDLIRSAAVIWGFMPPPLRAGTTLA